MTSPSNEPVTNGETSTPEVESLRARLEAAEKERDQYLALLKSTRAELENDLKRARRSFEDDKKYAHSGFALGLLPVLDNLERATLAAKQAGETGPLVQGVALVETQLRDLLRRQGIAPIEALNQTFDPTRHQAVMQQPTAAASPFTILKVLEEGWTIHDRVLRPANVIVAVAPVESPKKAE